MPTFLVADHQPHVVTQATPEKWVRQVSLGLIQIADGLSSRHRIMAQARELGKGEPHPVGPRTSFGELLHDLAIDVRLSVYETDKVGISHGHAPVGSIIAAAEKPRLKIVAGDTRYAVRVFRCPDYLKMLPRAEIPSSVGHLVPR